MIPLPVVTKQGPLSDTGGWDTGGWLDVFSVSQLGEVKGLFLATSVQRPGLLLNILGARTFPWIQNYPTPSVDGRESEWTPGVGDGQGGLACCDSWGRKESDTTERLNWIEVSMVAIAEKPRTKLSLLRQLCSFFLLLGPWLMQGLTEKCRQVDEIRP